MHNRRKITRFENARAKLWANAYILLTLTAIFWAGNSIVGRAARDLTPPVALAFWRWTFAFLLVLPLAWPHLKRDWSVLIGNWRIMLLLGALGIGAFNTLLYTGLQTTTALNGMLLQSAQPVLILLVGALLMKDNTSKRQIAGVVISLAGVFAIVAQGNISNLIEIEFNRGDMIIALAVCLWAVYSVLLRRRPQVHPLSFLAATLIIGVVLILPFYGAELASGRFIVATRDSWLAIAYVSIFPSFLAYLSFNRGIELIGSAATGQFMNILPVIGAGFAMIFLGERLQGFHLVGIALVLAGIIVAGKSKYQPPVPIIKFS